MKACKAHLVRWYRFLLILPVFLLAAVPAFSQRGNFGIDVGQVSDKFGALAPVTAPDFGLNGQITIIQANKDGRPNIVAGGELRLASDTSAHATEFAVFGGPSFPIHNFSVGLNAQVRKILLPTAFVDNTSFQRFDMELLEVPVVLKYKFGHERRAFIQAQGGPEFTPRLRMRNPPPIPVDKPNFDYGYTVRGSVGYTFGKWYAKGTYETRYFKFVQNNNNPQSLYNWRSNLITGGVGLIF